MAAIPHRHSSKTLRGPLPLINVTPSFDPKAAARALIEGLEYLKNRLDWSGTKIADILHLSPTTINTWLKNGVAPITNSHLHPDIQAIIHLLAIHRSLEAMFNDPAHQRAWLTTFHPDLQVTPLELMSKSIDGLIFIRQYLDYARGRGA